LKNRTFLGILCIVLAVLLVFAVSPLFNKVFDGKKSVVVLKSPVLKGQMLTSELLSAVEMGSYNLPENAVTDKESVIGKYAVSDLYANNLILPDMLTDSVDTSDSMLRNLKGNERAVSITIRQFANGVSGKLITGDIIKIVSVDDDKVAHIYEELEFVEVLTTTSGNGADNIERSPQPNLDNNGETDMPETITIIIQDDLQALRLAECENTSLHAVFVCRDEKRKDEYIKAQADILENLKAVNENGGEVYE